MKQFARAGWTTFRGWRWWVQVLVALVAVSAALAPFSSGGGEDQQVQSAAAGDPAVHSTTTTAATSTTTTSRPRPTTTTTTTPESPEGGRRSGTADVAEPGTSIPDLVDRGAVVVDDLARLDSLTVAPESHADSYDRALFPHWDDADHDGCDTRCEVLTAQRRPDGSWFSEWDGATETDPSLVHIDHVVALAEAWRSGAWAWTPQQRDDFADDHANLLAVSATSNIRKSDKDAAQWFPSRAAANCLWARTVVVVKQKWSLTVDPAEKTALTNLLASCGAVAPAPTTTAPTTTAAPPPPPTTAAPPPAGNDCTPGYSPCLPPAEDYDCQGGGGNGPAFTGRVTVDHSYGDPYGLDKDGDGVGCDS